MYTVIAGAEGYNSVGDSNAVVGVNGIVIAVSRNGPAVYDNVGAGLESLAAFLC